MEQAHLHETAQRLRVECGLAAPSDFVDMPQHVLESLHTKVGVAA